MNRSSADVIIVGAGAAGLAAARDLSQAGLRILQLEARPRIGGRILTLRDGRGALPVELGAEFIHGKAKETLSACDSARLIVDRLSGDAFLAKSGGLRPASDFWGKVGAFAGTLERRYRARGVRDRSFLESVMSARLRPQDRQLLLQFARGFQGADPRLLSSRSMAGEGAEASDDQFRIVSGYDALLDELRAQSDADCIDLHLETIVTEVSWKSGEVRVRTTSASGTGDREFRAKLLVTAVPHAVLKAGKIRFSPKVPGQERALGHLQVGQAFKIVLRFREAFWNEESFLRDRLRPASRDHESVGFLQSPGEDVPVWWTADPARSPVLTGWAGGPDAIPMLTLDEKSRVERSLQSLSRIVALPRRELDPLLERSWTHDWSQDPYSLGAYSYIGVGGIQAPAALARPVRDTLYFAGDFLDTATLGTVEGAIASGRRAALEILSAGP